MTSKDLSIFNSLRPFSVGFDDMFDQFESMLGNGRVVQNNYPPYNIRKAGKDKYAIEVAVAGFNKNDVEVEYEDNLLTVKTKDIKRSEEKELSKWLNKPEEDLKSFYGQPDKVEFLKTRNRNYVYITEKYKIKCERKFEVNSRNIVVGFSSKNCF